MSQPESESSPRRQSRSRRSRSRAAYSPSVSDDQTTNTKPAQRRKKPAPTSQLPMVTEGSGKAGKVNAMRDSKQAVQDTAQKIEDDGDDKILSLRLDLNLEVEIVITAKIHGDITLALLCTIAALWLA
ncbi:hypothetical protein FIBSPDRAFT_1048067 [Athelia psychrophila]|uniref:Uncharacterized protein n=1 Tax=Athelia psychrophila TaxID=1759441 RepID=A0A166EA98_9AGAM|nr:hypothetical protein FIBSPDRAFT_1048067 [Fibularhizoctonia sp. CBS 109695]